MEWNQPADVHTSLVTLGCAAAALSNASGQVTQQSVSQSVSRCTTLARAQRKQARSSSASISLAAAGQ